MLGKRIHLLTVFGFAINIDFSWFFLAVVVAWSLAVNAFPAWYKGLSTVAYLWMGITGALGLFVSIVLHELAHSVVARHHGIIMRGITLFIFGGVAEMTAEPPGPKAEFQVAIAGPLASVAISAMCYGLITVGDIGWPTAVRGVLNYLALINAVLVVFNMIPAFPLDGGRVLRAILWNKRKNLTSATRTTSRIGMGFAVLLIALGVIRVVLFADLIGGIWSFLIGLFLRNAANMSYQHLLVQQGLEGEQVHRFMKTDPVTVPAGVSITELVENYVYRYHFKMFPVMDGSRLEGCILVRSIRHLPRERWRDVRVSELTEACTEDNSIGPDADATDALAKMSQSGRSRLLVVENGRLLGIITLKDLLQFLSLKMELEGS